MMTTQETLGLWPEPLPALPKVLDGFMRDDEVWLIDGDRRIAARVIAVLQKSHQVVITTIDHQLITITPACEPGRILKRTPTKVSTPA